MRAIRSLILKQPGWINFVLDDDTEFKLPDDPINTLETTTSPKVAPEPPVLVYTHNLTNGPIKALKPKFSWLVWIASFVSW